MIKLTLYNQETGKEQTFTETYVSTRHLRQVLEFSVKSENGELDAVSQLDDMVSLVASVFNDENVTYDSILDGIPADEAFTRLDQIMTQILGGRASKEDQKNSKSNQTT